MEITHGATIVPQSKHFLELRNFTKAILAGTDCLLSTESQDDFNVTLKKAEAAPNAWDEALHKGAKNILYMVANSSAMFAEAHSGKDNPDLQTNPGDMTTEEEQSTDSAE